MSGKVTFADKSTRDRKQFPASEDMFCNVTSLLFPPPPSRTRCVANNAVLAVRLHKFHFTKAQLASAHAVLDPSKEKTYYLEELKQSVKFEMNFVPPVRPLPFSDDTSMCFFACGGPQKGSGCYLNAVLQLLASMTTLDDCSPKSVWEDIQDDPNPNIPVLVRYIALQMVCMKQPQAEKDAEKERARLRDIDEVLTASKKAATSLQDNTYALEHILDKLSASQTRVKDTLSFRYREGATSTTVVDKTVFDVTLVKSNNMYTSDLVHTFSQAWNFMGFKYLATTDNGVIGNCNCVVIRVSNASQTSTFSECLNGNTPFNYIDENNKLRESLFSKHKHMFMLRAVGVSLVSKETKNGDVEHVYTRRGNSWWRVTGFVENVSNVLCLSQGKLPDNNHAVRVLVYERHRPGSSQ